MICVLIKMCIALSILWGGKWNKLHKSSGCRNFCLHLQQWSSWCPALLSLIHNVSFWSSFRAEQRNIIYSLHFWHSLHAALSLSFPFALVDMVVTESQPRTVSLSRLVNMSLVAISIFSIKIYFSPWAKLLNLILACFCSRCCRHKGSDSASSRWPWQTPQATRILSSTRHTTVFGCMPCTSSSVNCVEKACSFSLVCHGTSEKAQVLLLTQGLFLMDAGRVAFMLCVHKVDILRVWVTGPSGGSGQRKLQQLWRWNQGREQRAHETWLRCSFGTRSMFVGYRSHRDTAQESL